MQKKGVLLNEVGLSGEIYSLGWGKEIKDIEVFEAVRDALGLSVEPLFDEKRPGEIDRICLTNTKAAKGLGWSPKVAFQEGIKLATEFYKERRTQPS